MKIYDMRNPLRPKYEKLEAENKRLREEVAKRPAKPLYGEARSQLLKKMDAANIDDAIAQWDKLQAENKRLTEVNRKTHEEWDDAAIEYERIYLQNEQLQATILERGKGITDRDTIIGKLKQKNEQLIVACKLALTALAEKGECYAKAAIEQALKGKENDIQKNQTN